MKQEEGHVKLYLLLYLPLRQDGPFSEEGNEKLIVL
jgi:hypothetical protein